MLKKWVAICFIACWHVMPLQAQHNHCDGAEYHWNSYLNTPRYYNVPLERMIDITPKQAIKHRIKEISEYTLSYQSDTLQEEQLLKRTWYNEAGQKIRQSTFSINYGDTLEMVRHFSYRKNETIVLLHCAADSANANNVQVYRYNKQQELQSMLEYGYHKKPDLGFKYGQSIYEKLDSVVDSFGPEGIRIQRAFHWKPEIKIPDYRERGEVWGGPIAKMDTTNNCTVYANTYNSDSTKYVFNKKGQVLYERHMHPGYDYEVDYTYDKNKRLVKTKSVNYDGLTYPRPYVSTYLYNSLGLLDKEVIFYSAVSEEDTDPDSPDMVMRKVTYTQFK
jgi:hypothetical protein